MSLGSTVLDVALFALMDWLLRGFSAELRLLGATVIARACSSLCNFAANRTLVFENREHPGPAMVRYYLLCIVQTAASYGGVYLLSAVLGLPSGGCQGHHRYPALLCQLPDPAPLGLCRKTP